MTQEKAVVIRAPVEVASFEELSQQTQRLNEFYKGLMQKGTDYDTIPGTPKPTLLKPGAELLRLWAGLTPQFDINNEGTDLERGIFNYEVKCSLYRGGNLVGEGVGSCNSLESKYRFRWVYTGGLPQGVDKEKLTMRWHKFASGKSLPQYRLENENPQDLANTILKMAKKRAFIDAILTVTGASRIFTQDIEDIKEVVSESTTTETEPDKEVDKQEVRPDSSQGMEQEAPGVPTGGGGELGFDRDWLTESLNKVHWKDNTVKSYCRNVYKTDSAGEPLDANLAVIALIASLSRENREAFFKEVNDRLKMI